MNEQARGPRRGPTGTPRPRRGPLERWYGKTGTPRPRRGPSVTPRPRRGPSVTPRPRGLPLGFLNRRLKAMRENIDLSKGRPRIGFGGTPMPTRRGPRPIVPSKGRNRLLMDQAGQALSGAVQKANEQARGNARRNQLIAEGEATRAGNKGMAVTKKAVGHNDFRKGGLTLSVVNNLKK